MSKTQTSPHVITVTYISSICNLTKDIGDSFGCPNNPYNNE
jgi:hypothetical protein